MNKTLLFSVLALTASVFADGDTTNSSALLADDSLVAGRMDNDCNPKPKECKPKPKPCEPCIRKGMAPIVLTSSRPCNDVGVYIFADALYWHADIDNSDYVFHQTSSTTAEPNESVGKNKETTFKWNWGFKVGLGFDLDHDQWDTDFYYTWFVNHSQPSHVKTDDIIIHPMVSLNSDFPAKLPAGFHNAKSKAKLNFNVLDWELGRWFYISNAISIRPHAGLKAAWIKLQETQKLAVVAPGLLAFTEYHVKNTNKSWAIGPSAGINSNWYFGCGNTFDMREGHRGEVRSRPHWSIFGDFSGALMYSHFNNKHHEHSTAGADVGFIPKGLNRNLMVPVLTGFMGLAYDTCFDCDKMHFGIRLGYELQYWFRQSQRFSFDRVGFPPRYTRAAEDLALQGMTIDVRFDF